MRSSKFFIACFAVLALVLAAGCGGSGQGLRLPDNPLVITSSTLPPTLSGELVDFEIPLSGGCEPKDYVVEVIDGHLPDGVGTVQGPVAKLEGYALVSGIFPFTIKITDVSCEPFYTTTQSYVWEIGDGPLAIVDANPGVIPVADYTDLQKYPDVDALQTVIYNQFSTIQFIVAGGVPGATGYTCAIVDDPNDPDDGQAPLGVGMAPNSCSLVGAPNQVLPGGVPFRLTIRATDSVGNTVERKFQWKVDTPPQIPNYGRKGSGMKLKKGMAICIEPMFNLGTAETQVESDGWTVVTADGAWSAHFEHTVAITEDGPKVLTVSDLLTARPSG